MTFSIYSRENLLTYAADYFKAPSQYDSGTRRHVVGKVLADARNGCSYFIVRRGHTGFTSCQQMQHGRVQRRDYYAIKSRDYCVARISWETQHIEELSVHATQEEAAKACKAAHLASIGAPGNITAI